MGIQYHGKHRSQKEVGTPKKITRRHQQGREEGREIKEGRIEMKTRREG
jgi:hypothetical protein